MGREDLQSQESRFEESGVSSSRCLLDVLSGNVNWTIGYMGLGFRGGIQATDVKCRSHWTFLDSFLCNCKDVLFCLLLS